MSASTCKTCGRAITLEQEKALDGDVATVWTDMVVDWVCPTTGDEHEPGEQPWWVVITHNDVERDDEGNWVPTEDEVPDVWVGPFTEEQAEWAVNDSPEIDAYCCDTKNDRFVDDVVTRQAALPDVNEIELWEPDLQGWGNGFRTVTMVLRTEKPAEGEPDPPPYYGDEVMFYAWSEGITPEAIDLGADPDLWS